MEKVSRALQGKRIVVTRAPGQTGELMAALERLGAEILLLPTVEFAPPQDFRELDAALRKIEQFDAIFFVSGNAVRYILARCGDLGIERKALNEVRLIAAVGSATADAARNEGLRVDYVANNQTGQALAEELSDRVRGRKVLLPRSDRGDERLPAILRESGAEVTEVIAYRTVAPKSFDPEILRRLKSGEVDAILFASPSAFHNLCGVIPRPDLARISETVEFAAIGPTTARAIRESGARVGIEAAESSSTALVEAMRKRFGAPGSTPSSTASTVRRT